MGQHPQSTMVVDQIVIMLLLTLLTTPGSIYSASGLALAGSEERALSAKPPQRIQQSYVELCCCRQGGEASGHRGANRSRGQGLCRAGLQHPTAWERVACGLLGAVWSVAWGGFVSW